MIIFQTLILETPMSAIGRTNRQSHPQTHIIGWACFALLASFFFQKQNVISYVLFWVKYDLDM